MIYPSIAELTKNTGINRYTLVIAAAKSARVITDEYVRQREYAEKLALSKDADKSKNIANLIKREYRDDKAVKLAVAGLYNGEFRILSPEEAEELRRREAEEAAEKAAGHAEEKAAEETAADQSADESAEAPAEESAAEETPDAEEAESSDEE